MKEVKFRQPIYFEGKFYRWHYWGFLKHGVFTAPESHTETWLKSQQYTNLKDRNGKEIYEGDILNGHGFFSGYEVVRFDLGQFTPSSSFRDIENNILEYEIISNIYENPELMGKK